MSKKHTNDCEQDSADLPPTQDNATVSHAAVESVEGQQHVFDTTRQAITYLRDKLREAHRETPEEAAEDVLATLPEAQRDTLFKALLAKEANQAGLFPKKRGNINELSADFTSGGYPYKNRYPLGLYEKELYDLQVELLKLQEWVKRTGRKIVVIFEGRDAAGKGGTIRRFTENLNPRGARIVALSKPTEAEAGQWYFQRYAARLPNPGEICFFDRSWYNRAVVEPVMGFCTKEQSENFLLEVSEFERSLQRGGIILIKFWLNISQEEQRKRFKERRVNPLKRWKLSPVDIASMEKWDDYSLAVERMFHATDTTDTPWTVIRNEDKRRGRLNAIRVLLQSVDYDGRDLSNIGPIDPLIVGRGGMLFQHTASPIFAGAMSEAFKRDLDRVGKKQKG
ncbi:MAG: polyphosphate kinase 2 [Sutterella sp.]|nr:polyphosphate kinase 2 [Sutterella sp.]